MLDFSLLEKSITGVICEQQIKLGYRREAVRIYYPLDSLNAILGTEDSLMQMIEHLHDFSEYVLERIGEVEITSDGERFCFVIPPSGSEYIHTHCASEPFLNELIEMLRRHDVNMDDIFSVFDKYSSKVHKEKVKTNEFDYLLYFEDGKPDEYYYCFTEEGKHVTYHRFTKQDYEKNGL